jgi:hypothetical protein
VGGDGYQRFISTIPETPFDRLVLDFLAAIPGGMAITTRFGLPDCPPGMAVVEPIGCCWEFGGGAAKVIERLSLGAANVWVVNWLCEPDGDADPTVIGSPGSAATGELSNASPRGPWFVRHPDVGLSVFPTGIDAVLHGESGVIHIPAGTLVGRMAYSPNGQKAFAPHNLTYAVAHAFEGFGLMFDCMSDAASRRLGMPAYFLGDAPEKRMCLFLKHFGFDIIDNGDIGATVFAPVERVRSALDEQRARAARLLERADRESRRPANVALVLP